MDIKRFVKKLSGAGTPSLETSMRTMDDLVALYGKAVECYGAAMDSIAGHAPETPRVLREEHRQRLKNLRVLLLASPGARMLEDTRKQLDIALGRYGQDLGRHLDRQERDAKEIMAMVAAMADSMASRDTQYNVRFRGIAKKLRLLTTSQDLAEIRLKLAEEVGQLEKYVEDMAGDTKTAVERVKADLQARREAAPEPWLEGADPVTDLAGRPEFVAVVDILLRKEARFCIARFTIDKQAALVARHGQAAGDAVLREFAAHLKEGLADAAAVCRWAQDEFLSAVACPLPEMAMRASALEQKLSNAYSLASGRERVIVTCFSAVVQALRGETVEQMVGRLEEARCCAE